jgi:abortive infection bacteriophage resistance protein
VIYSKPVLSIPDQIKKLQSRGLIINDIPLAKHYLINVGYYRLSGYWLAMQADKVNHIFKPNSTFENVVSIYQFDRELRLLLFDIIERIEIALRTKMVYHLSHELNPWWFEDSHNFKDASAHNETLKSIDRELSQTKEEFIKQHYLKYNKDTRRPPSWKTLNIASFGTISKLYGNLSDRIKSKDIIASEFGTVNRSFLPSWLQSISQIRNICAHHGRIWNKNLPGKPRLLPRPPYKWINYVPPVAEQNRLYIHICCMKYMFDLVDTNNQIPTRLKDLFKKHPNIDPTALGFPKDWLKEPLWN